MARVMDPWIGSRYEHGGINKLKLLVLGESSYKREGYPESYDLSQHNRNLALDAIGYEEGARWWNASKFYTRITRMFGFDARRREERQEFWNSVCFCNFLQVILTGPRKSPSREAWQEATGPLLQTLQELRPDYLLSFSMRMWGYLPPRCGDVAIPNQEGVFARKAQIQLMDGTAVSVLGFQHPVGRGFTWRRVGVVLCRALDIQDDMPQQTTAINPES